MLWSPPPYASWPHLGDRARGGCPHRLRVPPPRPECGCEQGRRQWRPRPEPHRPTHTPLGPPFGSLSAPAASARPWRYPAASAAGDGRGGHEVGPHRLRRLVVGTDVEHARPAPAQDLQLHRDGHAEGLAQRQSAAMPSGPGREPGCRGVPGRRRGWSRSTRRRRRIRARRCAPGRRPTGSRTTPSRHPPRWPRGAPGAPKTTRQTRAGGRQRRRAGARRSARRSAPARRAGARACARCRARARAWPSAPARHRASRGRSPPAPAARWRPSPSAPRCAAGRSAGRRPRGPARRRRDGAGWPSVTPAASRAATIAPAEVPTKASTSRSSAPASSSMPARTPVIHASPMTPPPARTRTSGTAKAGTRLSLRGGAPVRRRRLAREQALGRDHAGWPVCVGTANARRVHTPTLSDHANVLPSGDHVSLATVPWGWATCSRDRARRAAGPAGGRP